MHINNPRRTISIFGSRHQEPFLPQIAQLLESLHMCEFQTAIHPRLYAYLLDRIGRIPDSCHKSDLPAPGSEAVLSIGGDGTFLRTAQWVAERQIPILGINTGHLGFLSMCDIEEPDSIAQALHERSLIVEKRSLLSVDTPLMPADFRPFALNEVAILKQDTASMITVQTKIDNSYLTDYLADGLIISTPTGSTGYNLSVGGPILRPTLDNWVLSPVAPHSLTMRPLVVNSDAIIQARTISRADTYRVSLDGRSFSLPCGSVITIRKADFSVLVMRRPDDNFAGTLRNKLLWGAR